MKKTIKFYLFLDFLVILCALFFGLKWLISSQVSFIFATLIVFISIMTYKKVIFDEIHSGKYDEIDTEDEEQAKKPKVSKLHFFSIYKILAYALFFASFYLLAKFKFLDIFGFIAGIFPIIPTAFFALLKKS